jgi:hypothetical protein
MKLDSAAEAFLEFVDSAVKILVGTSLFVDLGD